MVTPLEFDEGKFKELILFFTDGAKDDPCFASTVLNKMLFAAEFLAYKVQGRPIAGATYVHRNYGPVPQEFIPVRNALVAEGSLTIEDKTYLGREQKKPRAHRGPNLSSFNDIERQVCEHILKMFSGVQARHARDWSHLFPGYILSQEGEQIPYPTAWLGRPRKPVITAADQRWAQDLIDQLQAVPT